MNQKLGGRKKRLMEPKQKEKWCDNCCQQFTGSSLLDFTDDNVCDNCMETLDRDEVTYLEQCRQRNSL